MRTINYFYSCIFLVVFSNTLLCQAYWLYPEIDQDKYVMLKDDKGKIYLKEEIQNAINYNPVINLNEEEISLNLADYSLHHNTIFTVFDKDFTSKEEHIWNISNNHIDNLLLTSSRVADRRKGSFINFNKDLESAHLSVFHQLVQDFPSTELQLGGSAHDPLIPINPFSGELAELIIFDKLLAPLSKQILESNLAIKYSIPLSKGSDYYGKNGQVIWPFDSSSPFCFNVAGLGRNDDLKLYQKQSISKINSGFLSIALKETKKYNYLNNSILNNGSYLLWADNNLDISFSLKNNGINFLDRVWKFEPTSFDESQVLELLIQEENIIREKANNNHVWCYWNNSSDPSFTLDNLNLFKAEINNSVIIFDSIYFNNLYPYLHVFYAPAFWVALEIDNPNCAENKTGTIHGSVLGPEPPYTITLNSSNNNVSYRVNSRSFTIPNLESNKYDFVINTDDGNSWRTDVFLLETSMKDNPLLPSYTLDKGQSISLDVSTLFNNDNIKYTWILPNGEIVYDSRIKLKEAGKYALLIRDDGCEALFETTVISTSNNIKYCKLFPNPTTSGNYILRGRLINPVPYTILVTSITGETIYREEFPASIDINFYGNIQRNGTYIVSLISGESKYNSKLIVIQN